MATCLSATSISRRPRFPHSFDDPQKGHSPDLARRGRAYRRDRPRRCSKEEAGYGYAASVLERLEKLEKQNHRLRVATLLVFALSGAALLMGQTFQDRTVEAERSVLKEPSGKARAELAMTPHRATLSLLDPNGKTRAELDATMDAAGLTFCDANGNRSAGLGVEANGAGLGFYDANRMPRAGVAVTGHGATITIRDENGKLLFSQP